MRNSDVFPIVLASSSKTFSMFYNLSISYISSYLKQHGIKPILLDNNRGDSIKKQLLHILKKYRPKFIGFSINMSNREISLAIMQFAKELDPDVITIAGGHPPSVLPTAYCDDYDYIIRGDGEIPLYEMLTDKDPHEIEGCFFKENGKTIDNGTNYEPHNLEVLGVPDYDWLFSGRKTNLFDKIFNVNMYPTFSTRGCGGQCIFCTGKEFNKKHRVRAVENVLEEVKLAKDKYGATSIGFGDPCFSYNMDYTRKLCHAFIENKDDMLPFRISTRIDRLSFDLIDLLKEAGCIGIGIGLETADRHLMRVINKSHDISKTKKLIEYCDAKGMHVMVSVIYGIYGETSASMKKTLDMTLDLPFDGAVYSMFVMDQAIVGNGYKSTHKVTKLPAWRITAYQIYSYMRFYIRPFFIRRLFFRKENRRQIFFVGFFLLNIIMSAAKTPKFILRFVKKSMSLVTRSQRTVTFDI